MEIGNFLARLYMYLYERFKYMVMVVCQKNLRLVTGHILFLF